MVNRVKQVSKVCQEVGAVWFWANRVLLAVLTSHLVEGAEEGVGVTLGGLCCDESIDEHHFFHVENHLMWNGKTRDEKM